MTDHYTHDFEKGIGRSGSAMMPNNLVAKDASPTDLLLGGIGEKLEHAHESLAQLNAALMPVMRAMPEEEKKPKEIGANQSLLEMKLSHFDSSIERIINDIASIKRCLSI